VFANDSLVYSKSYDLSYERRFEKSEEKFVNKRLRLTSQSQLVHYADDDDDDDDDDDLSSYSS